MTEVREPFDDKADDLLIAWLRRELSDEARQQVEMRIARESGLREELRVLEAAADLFWDEAAAATAQASCADIRAKLGVARDGEAHAVAAARAQPERASAPWFARFRQWLAAHASIVQPALIALVLAQSGVIAHYLSGAQDGAAPMLAVRGAAGSCNDAWVTFKDGVTEQQMRHLLTLYGASIVAGPDDSGRYRLGFADVTAREALQQSVEAAQTVARFEAPAGCDAGAGGQPSSITQGR
ncbi:hypothetical protein [Paraburkholderia pallida]|uniref:Uncharacterized protein n=1 Tax=Paraburkholderia pallida TaxID=2547399 RepID=A0A4P7CZG2_9BURK|nr:hypothetical protein [Paraburkholderia pallida]QBQ99511.1 hypothetical protein E1956_20255 [Paraburkholderia pallida]